MNHDIYQKQLKKPIVRSPHSFDALVLFTTTPSET